MPRSKEDQYEDDMLTGVDRLLIVLQQISEDLRDIKDRFEQQQDQLKDIWSPKSGAV